MDVAVSAPQGAHYHANGSCGFLLMAPSASSVEFNSVYELFVSYGYILLGWANT